MRRTTDFLPHSVDCALRDDGTRLLRSTHPLGPVADRTGDWLHRWTDTAPDRTFLAERSGAGWREVAYVSALQQVRTLAAALVGRGMGPDTAIVVISGNGIDHGLLALAAQYAGIPVVPVAEQYALIPGAHARLVEVIRTVRPRMVYAVDADQYATALALEDLQGTEVVTSRNPAAGMTAFDDLLRGDAAADVDAAFAAVTPDTVAKILMTSGSTSSPKGVLTTHRMLCVNQTQLADAMPFLRARPPVIVDWLPWNHVFGGSHNFNMMLANGGSLYIDDGKPVKGAFDRTLENLALQTGTLAFNVPVGFAMLVDALRRDDALRRRYFESLDLIFYAGASLPSDVWQALEGMAMEVRGEIPLMTSSWGLTETAPATMMQHEPVDRSGIVGVPLPGVTVKLIPTDDNRFEVRVKGANIMPGYFEAPEKTAQAFDAEGFFVTGDAMSFVDPADPGRGMRFDGRISDDFKLLTGTWVRAAQLRLDLLTHLAPLASDLVVTGADRDRIGLLIFPNRDHMAAQGIAETEDAGLLDCPTLAAHLRDRLATWARVHTGSSTRVSRAAVLAAPPSIGEGEITAKGNLNARKVLTLRKDLLDRLYSDGDPAVITL